MFVQQLQAARQLIFHAKRCQSGGLERTQYLFRSLRAGLAIYIARDGERILAHIASHWAMSEFVTSAEALRIVSADRDGEAWVELHLVFDDLAGDRGSARADNGLCGGDTKRRDALSRDHLGCAARAVAQVFVDITE